MKTVIISICVAIVSSTIGVFVAMNLIKAPPQEPKCPKNLYFFGDGLRIEMPWGCENGDIYYTLRQELKNSKDVQLCLLSNGEVLNCKKVEPWDTSKMGQK